MKLSLADLDFRQNFSGSRNGAPRLMLRARKVAFSQYDLQTRWMQNFRLKISSEFRLIKGGALPPGMLEKRKERWAPGQGINLGNFGITTLQQNTHLLNLLSAEMIRTVSVKINCLSRETAFLIQLLSELIAQVGDRKKKRSTKSIYKKPI